MLEYLEAQKIKYENLLKQRSQATRLARELHLSTVEIENLTYAQRNRDRRCQPHYIDEALKEDGTIVNDPDEVQQVFQDYFAKLFTANRDAQDDEFTAELSACCEGLPSLGLEDGLVLYAETDNEEV